MQYWSTKGFGFCMSEVETTIERLQNLLEKAPCLSEDIKDWTDDCDIDELTLEDFDGWDADYGGCRVGAVVAEAMTEIYGHEFFAVSNEDGVVYVIKAAAMPWEYQDNERTLTLEEVIKMFEDTLAVLTDNAVEIDDQCVCSFG